MIDSWFYTDAGDYDIPVTITRDYIIGYGLFPKSEFLEYAEAVLQLNDIDETYEEDSIVWGTIDWYNPETKHVTPGYDWEVTYIERF
jgi:hypothetical protein